MKYKVKFVMETEFECSKKKELKTLMWNSVSEEFNKSIFAPITKDSLDFVTLTNEKGKVINLKTSPHTNKGNEV